MVFFFLLVFLPPAPFLFFSFTRNIFLHCHFVHKHLFFIPKCIPLIPESRLFILLPWQVQATLQSNMLHPHDKEVVTQCRPCIPEQHCHEKVLHLFPMRRVTYSSLCLSFSFNLCRTQLGLSRRRLVSDTSSSKRCTLLFDLG